MEAAQRAAGSSFTDCSIKEVICESDFTTRKAKPRLASGTLSVLLLDGFLCSHLGEGAGVFVPDAAGCRGTDDCRRSGSLSVLPPHNFMCSEV